MIYIIRMAGSDLYKIGKTDDDNPERRMKELQQGNPYPLKVVAFFEGGQKEEFQMHDHLSDYRVSGEWFKLTDEDFFTVIVNHVHPDKMKIEHDPDKQAHHFKRFLALYSLSRNKPLRKDLGIERSLLYDYYVLFCKHEGVIPIAKRFFDQEVQKFGIGRLKARDGFIYYAMQPKTGTLVDFDNTI